MENKDAWDSYPGWMGLMNRLQEFWDPINLFEKYASIHMSAFSARIIQDFHYVFKVIHAP